MVTQPSTCLRLSDNTAGAITWWRRLPEKFYRNPILLPLLSHGRLQTCDSARRQDTVTSQHNDLPLCHGMSVRPSGLFPSDRNSPMGSLVTGIPAEAKLRAITSLRAWCLADLPGALLHTKLWSWYCFRDIRQFQSKIAKVFQPTSNLRTHWRVPSNWVPVLGIKKTRMMGLPSRQRSLTIIFILLDRMHERDRRTDMGPQ